MKVLAGVMLAAACLACSGCLVLATVSAAGAVAATTIKTTGKVTGAAVRTTGRVVSGTLNAPAEPVALTVDSAAKLARPGTVVVVDGDSGAATQVPWQEGMTLAVVVPAGKPGRFSEAEIFRDDRVRPADLRQAWTRDVVLQSGDVVELRR